MPAEMQGRRILLPDGYGSGKIGPYWLLTNAGDYCGPDKGEYTGGIPAVHFLLPIAADADDDPKWGRSQGAGLHHVQSPPHTFREEPDGTLTIRNSIGAGPPPYYWHGFLTEGRWELSPSKP